MAHGRIVTQAQLAGELPDNNTRRIQPQMARDMAATARGFAGPGAPDVFDDSANTRGTGFWDIGYQWVDTSTGIIYKCLDATPLAAVWVQVYPPAVSSLTFSGCSLTPTGQADTTVPAGQSLTMITLPDVFDDNEYDTDDYHTGPNQFTVPLDGYYHLGINTIWGNDIGYGATGLDIDVQPTAWLLVNDEVSTVLCNGQSTSIEWYEGDDAWTAFADHLLHLYDTSKGVHSASVVLKLSAGDVVDLRIAASFDNSLGMTDGLGVIDFIFGRWQIYRIGGIGGVGGEGSGPPPSNPFIQATSNTGGTQPLNVNTQTLTATFESPVTVGNSVVAFFMLFGGGANNPVPQITFSYPAGFQEVQIDNTNDLPLADTANVWVGTAILPVATSADTTFTVTATCESSLHLKGAWRMALVEVTGLDSSPVDQLVANKNTGTNGFPVPNAMDSGFSATSAQADEYWLAMFWDYAEGQTFGPLGPPNNGFSLVPLPTPDVLVAKRATAVGISHTRMTCSGTDCGAPVSHMILLKIAAT